MTQAALPLAKAIEDPIRLYSKPFWFDGWFITPLVLIAPGFVAFAYECIVAAGSNGYIAIDAGSILDILIQTIVVVTIFSLIPASIRYFNMKGKLRTHPDRNEPDFYQDPIRIGNQRFWNGTSWTALIRFPRKRSLAKIIVIASALAIISLIANLARVTNEISTIRETNLLNTVTYAQNSFNQLQNSFSEDVNEMTWPEYASAINDNIENLHVSSEMLGEVLEQTPIRDYWGNSYLHFTRFARDLDAFVLAAQAFGEPMARCNSSDVACFEAASTLYSDAYSMAEKNLVDSYNSIDYEE